MNKLLYAALLFIVTAFLGLNSHAQNNSQALTKLDLAALPGKGLLQHDFLYTGEADERHAVYTIYLVHKGRVTWTYDVAKKDSTGATAELGAAIMRPNGNVVFCRKNGATEVNPDKKVVWNYDAPKGTEIHAVEAVGDENVLMTINGVPSRTMLIDTKTGKTLWETHLPVGKPSPHLQFRRAVMTPVGTILAAHLDSDAVSEYDTKGKLLWWYQIKKPWCAARTKNGNTLITSNNDSCLITEVNKKGDIVWQLSQKDVPGITLYQIQVAVRLDNGNTIFSNWCHNGIRKTDDWPNSVQLIEVTSAKKVVWALSQWKDPDIGLASSIQILDGMDLDKIAAFRIK